MFFFLVTCLSKGAEATDWLTCHVVTANESHYCDYFLLDVARLLCLPFAPSISDCFVFPLDLRRWAGNLFLSSVFSLLSDCLEVACLLSARVNFRLDSIFLLYSVEV